MYAPVRVRGCLIDGSDPVTCKGARQSCDQKSCDPESVDRVCLGSLNRQGFTLKKVPLPCLPLSLNHHPSSLSARISVWLAKVLLLLPMVANLDAPPASRTRSSLIPRQRRLQPSLAPRNPKLLRKMATRLTRKSQNQLHAVRNAPRLRRKRSLHSPP